MQPIMTAAASNYGTLRLDEILLDDILRVIR
jgi:hypothetical protein